MKKTICIVLAFALLLLASGCGQTTGAPETEAALPAETPETAASSVEPGEAPAQAEETAAPLSEGEQVDVDLTQLSSTMVYSEVYAMVYEPEQYMGKTVKMRGMFATQEYDGNRLYACIIQDATACCAQGLEFELAEALVYPDDYPEPGAEITVIGTFDTYMEDAGNGNSYVYLVLREARLL